ncbi:MAG: hypothetical protein HY791_11550 [Deltaproteobacteria bacterium]|nr:hypothetical protein [Deltaproteobacteria bacterium]
MKRALVLLLCAGCAASSSSSKRRVDGPHILDRTEFNRIAQELFLPLFWMNDTNPNGAPDPDEVAVLWGYGAKRSEFVANGGFTTRAEETIGSIRRAFDRGHEDEVSPDEAQRLEIVRKELAQGRPTLLLSRFENPEDREVVRNLRDAAEGIERLYALQTGAAAYSSAIPATDRSSLALFRRNQGPWCEAPLTENDERCSALPQKPKKRSGLYPPGRVVDEAFCASIAADEQLSDHFSAISERDGALVAVPYSDFFADQTTKVALSLRKAADALGPAEAAFATYLRAAEAAFLNNKWSVADEAWARMSATNSRWYLRIGPDETYFEPCNQKAGFHMSFAKINPASLEWQGRLDALKTDMEVSIAELAGPPYAARNVDFDLPDFIDVVLNAGDSRSAIGATIGQSLPNWGPVANEGRGRTVAMTNLDSDPDSVRAARETSSALLCAKTMSMYTDDPAALLMSTVLHEAAHNLGPAHEYKVDGKTDEELFGGPLSSTLEELKAQSAAMFYADWLVERDKLTKQEADRTHLKDVTWMFGQISRGMTTSEGQPKSYSQLSAVQLGALMNRGAVTWKAENAANGKDTGCFEVDFDKLKPAVKELMSIVAQIKARGDRAGAEALLAEHVKGEVSKLFPVITERLLRAPRSSFVYAVELGE